MATPKQQQKIYSDILTDLTLHPISKDLGVKTNEESVKQSIRNLVLTNRGERLLQPNLGGDVSALLFSIITPQTINNAKQFIEQTIKNHEPRANLIDVVVTPTEDQNAIAITIIFHVINIQEPISLDMVLERIR